MPTCVLDVLEEAGAEVVGADLRPGAVRSGGGWRLGLAGLLGPPWGGGPPLEVGLQVLLNQPQTVEVLLVPEHLHGGARMERCRWMWVD